MSGAGRVWGELIGATGPPQRREDVEFPSLELVSGEDIAAGEVETPRQTGDPGQHMQRTDVGLGQLASPIRDDAIDIVGRRTRALHVVTVVLRTENLDVKTLMRVAWAFAIRC